MSYMLDEEVARKVLTTVDAGLVSGMGNPVAGHMCVEAAVCFALGQEHGDRPVCVGSAVRGYKIAINDARWSSNDARAKGLRRVAIAQLGSDKINQDQFSFYVIVEIVKRILPIALRAAASRNPKHAEVILATIPACEAVTDLKSARAAAKAARAPAAAADAAAAAAAAAAAYADAYAAADAAADAAAAAAADAAAAAAAAVYAHAAADAAAAAAAAAYADAAADAAAAAARDKVLSLAAEIAVEALQEQNCEGCQWLWLTEIA